MSGSLCYSQLSAMVVLARFHLTFFTWFFFSISEFLSLVLDIHKTSCCIAFQVQWRTVFVSGVRLREYVKWVMGKKLITAGDLSSAAVIFRLWVEFASHFVSIHITRVKFVVTSLVENGYDTRATSRVERLHIYG